MDYSDDYQARQWASPLPDDGLAGIDDDIGGDLADDMGADMGAPSSPSGTALPAATTDRRVFVRLPNGVQIDVVKTAAQVGAPVSAILAAALAVSRARSLAEGQALVDQVERSYGLPGTALQRIAAAMMPVVQAPASMKGMGNFLSDAWDTAVDVGKSAVGVAVDASTAIATGGASLLLPGDLQPGNAVTDPGGWIRGIKTEAAPAVFDGSKWIAQSLGQLGGKTLVSAGNLLKNFNAVAPAPAPPVRQASLLGNIPLPWLLAGGGLLAYLLLRKKEHHT